MLTVIGLHDLTAHLCDDSSRQLEETIGTLHILTYGTYAQGRDAVAHTGIDHLAQVIDAGQLSICTDKYL